MMVGHISCILHGGQDITEQHEQEQQQQPQNKITSKKLGCDLIVISLVSF